MHLEYVVRDQADSDRTPDFQGDFISKTIAYETQSGAHLQDNTRKANQLLKNYLVAKTAKQWTSSIEKCANGQNDFDALFRHYSREGNVTRRV